MSFHRAGARPPVNLHLPKTTLQGESPEPAGAAGARTIEAASGTRVPQQQAAFAPGRTEALAERIQHNGLPSPMAMARLVLTVLGLAGAVGAAPASAAGGPATCAGVDPPPGLLDELASFLRDAWDVETGRGKSGRPNGQFFIAHDTFDASSLEAFTATACGSARKGQGTDVFFAYTGKMTMALPPAGTVSEELARLYNSRFMQLTDPENPYIKLATHAFEVNNQPDTPLARHGFGVVSLLPDPKAKVSDILSPTDAGMGIFHEALTVRPAALIVGTTGRLSSDKVQQDAVNNGLVAATVPLGHGAYATVITRSAELAGLQSFAAAHPGEVSLEGGPSVQTPAPSGTPTGAPGSEQVASHEAGDSSWPSAGQVFAVIGAGAGIAVVGYLTKRPLAAPVQAAAQPDDGNNKSNIDNKRSGGNWSDRRKKAVGEKRINGRKRDLPPDLEPTTNLKDPAGSATPTESSSGAWNGSSGTRRPEEYVLRHVTDEVRDSLDGLDKATRKTSLEQWGIRLGLAMSDPNPLRRAEAAGILLGLVEYSRLNNHTLALCLTQLNSPYNYQEVLTAVESASESMDFVNHELSSAIRELDAAAYVLRDAERTDLSAKKRPAEKARLGPARRLPHAAPRQVLHHEAPEHLRPRPNVTVNLGELADEIRGRVATVSAGHRDFFVGPANGELHLHVGPAFITLKKKFGSNFEVGNGNLLRGTHLRDARLHVRARLPTNPSLAPIVDALNILWQRVLDEDGEDSKR